ncbi:GDSL-type esterase/lipase family protein [Vitreoscilla massiliensis]|uniref:GDSL-type esterase/lipase family protein n=1 Tax=Vitreoscilla massiliensis TaxID=1689272 RepID=A0ABY4DY21_9NEIS|nr:GDSL-type esterase/lipase family protein [Vitreoscilla massiliensis]UOO88040.1 GDSL-type esterase/lipase family protein [Vitreoscilla massiliensis]
MIKHLMALLSLVLLLCGLSACSKPESALPAQTTVLILGDSLTQGVGASAPEHAYPALLRQQTGWNIVNGGVSGNTSAQALARLPALLQQHQPKLVIISIGGNDFLQRRSNSDTRANIQQSIRLSQQSGAQVLLVAVPELTLAAAVGHPNDHAMYAALAKEEQVYLLEDAWSDVLADDALRADAVHANDAGYQVFTKQLRQRLEQIGWLD